MPAIFRDKPLKRFKRTLLNSALCQTLLAALLSCYIRLVYATSKIERNIENESLAFLQGQMQAIFIFWHGRMMMIPPFKPPGRKLHMLISQHRDGLLISRVINHFGCDTVSGSTSKGGLDAVKEIITFVKRSENIAITPDGPRGPAFEVTEGTLRLAKLTGLPVIPVSFSSSRYKRMRSWDSFVVALPFSRLMFIAGKPVYVAREDSAEVMEQKRYALQIDLQAITSHADAQMGLA